MGKQTDFYYVFFAVAVCANAFLTHNLDVMQWKGQLPSISVPGLCGDWTDLPLTLQYPAALHTTTHQLLVFFFIPISTNAIQPCRLLVIEKVYVAIQKWSCWGYLEMWRKLHYDPCDNYGAWWIVRNPTTSFKPPGWTYYHQETVNNVLWGTGWHYATTCIYAYFLRHSQ